jgi:uncharacterized repeat protein (TIGR01451 family)
VAYTSTVPAGTSLTIDVLDVNDDVVLSDVSSDASLAALDPNLYPSLKLRANLTTNDTAVTPRLDEWSITWQPMSPSLSIGKNAVPGPVFPGDLLTYTIILSEKSGLLDVTGAQVTDTVPAHTTCPSS